VWNLGNGEVEFFNFDLDLDLDDDSRSQLKACCHVASHGCDVAITRIACPSTNPPSQLT
jgi:hypothetical protein